MGNFRCYKNLLQIKLKSSVFVNTFKNSIATYRHISYLYNYWIKILFSRFLPVYNFMHSIFTSQEYPQNCLALKILQHTYTLLANEVAC